MSERVHRSYRLSVKVADDLARWAGEDGISATELVERAVRLYGEMNHTGNHGGDTENHTVNHDGDALAALTAQLAVKDEQIARLMDALSQAQETVKAAQVLDAAHTAKALEGETDVPTDASNDGGDMAASDPQEVRGLFGRLRHWLKL